MCGRLFWTSGFPDVIWKCVKMLLYGGLVGVHSRGRGRAAESAESHGPENDASGWVLDQLEFIEEFVWWTIEGCITVMEVGCDKSFNQYDRCCWGLGIDGGSWCFGDGSKQAKTCCLYRLWRRGRHSESWLQQRDWWWNYQWMEPKNVGFGDSRFGANE